MKSGRVKWLTEFIIHWNIKSYSHYKLIIIKTSMIAEENKVVSIDENELSRQLATIGH